MSGLHVFSIFVDDLEISIDNHPTLFKYATTLLSFFPFGVIMATAHTDLVHQFLIWSKDNSMICNPSKCKELIFRKKGFIQDIAQVNNVPKYNIFLC